MELAVWPDFSISFEVDCNVVAIRAKDGNSIVHLLLSCNEVFFKVVQSLETECAMLIFKLTCEIQPFSYSNPNIVSDSFRSHMWNLVRALKLKLKMVLKSEFKLLQGQFWVILGSALRMGNAFVLEVSCQISTGIDSLL